MFGEKLSYKVCDESLAELEKLSQGKNGMCYIAAYNVTTLCYIKLMYYYSGVQNKECEALGQVPNMYFHQCLAFCKIAWSFCFIC